MAYRRGRVFSGRFAVLVSKDAEAEGSEVSIISSRILYRSLQHVFCSLCGLCVSAQRYLCADSDKILTESAVFRLQPLFLVSITLSLCSLHFCTAALLLDTMNRSTYPEGLSEYRSNPFETVTSLTDWIAESYKICRDTKEHCKSHRCVCACSSGHCSLPSLLSKQKSSQPIQLLNTKQQHKIKIILAICIIFEAFHIFLNLISIIKASATPTSPASTPPQGLCEWDYLHDV